MGQKARQKVGNNPHQESAWTVESTCVPATITEEGRERQRVNLIFKQKGALVYKISLIIWPVEDSYVSLIWDEERLIHDIHLVGFLQWCLREYGSDFMTHLGQYLHDTDINQVPRSLLRTALHLKDHDLEVFLREASLYKVFKRKGTGWSITNMPRIKEVLEELDVFTGELLCPACRINIGDLDTLAKIAEMKKTGPNIRPEYVDMDLGVGTKTPQRSEDIKIIEGKQYQIEKEDILDEDGKIIGEKTHHRRITEPETQAQRDNQREVDEWLASRRAKTAQSNKRRKKGPQP